MQYSQTQIPWRALARQVGLQREAATGHHPTLPSAPARPSRPYRARRVAAYGRRHGWGRLRSPVRLKYAFDVRTIEEDLEIYYEDACDSPYYGCGESGCCVDDEWWAWVIPPHPFMRQGIVHMSSIYASIEAVCGRDAVPYGVDIRSTDEARAYCAAIARTNEDVTCLECIVYGA